MALLKTDKLRKIYATEDATTVALQSISLSIPEGQFVAIMGPSGSGKSTLLHLLGLLDHPTSGQYLLNGHDSTTLTENELAQLRNETIGFIFQAFNLLPRTTVYDNVLLPLRYSAVPRSQWKQRAEAVLESVGLTHRLHHTTAQLSGGEKQRVAIARALINNPKLILADEPTGNLDSVSGQHVMETIDQLHKKGHTIVVITHETPTASYAQRIVRLKDGEIIADEENARHGHEIYTK